MYTRSTDGKFRTGVHFSARFEKDELAELNSMARALGHKNFREFAEGEMDNILLRLSDRFNEHVEFEKEFGL